MAKDMTKGNIVKLILTFSIPLLIGNIFQQFYNMADTIIVGRFLGVDKLAAVGSTGSMIFLINGFVVGLTSGLAVMVAQKFGAKDEQALKKAVSSSIVICIIATIIITVLSITTAKSILTLMNTPSNIFNDAIDYIYIIYAGTIATLAYNMISSILRALGDSKTPLYFLVVSSILNIILDIVFIVKLSMDVSGAAYATIISQGLSAILCLIYSIRKYKVLTLKKEDFRFDNNIYSDHLKVAIPMALQFSITGIGIMIVQSALNMFGSLVIASYTAASKVFQIIMQPSITLGIAMATFCAQNLGGRKYERIKEGVNKTTKISIVISIISGFLLVFTGKYFVRLFIENPNEEILGYAQAVFNYSAYFYIPLGFIFVYRNALQGMGESFVPMMAGVYELVARAVAAFTLPAVIGFTGICLSDPLAWIAASTPLMYTYFKKINSILSKQTDGLLNTL